MLRLLASALVATVGAPGLPSAALQYGAQPVTVPAEEVAPMVHEVHAQGTCAILRTDLGFIAVTIDDGQNFRYAPTPDGLDWDARLYCAGDRFFIVRRGGPPLRLVRDTWQPVATVPAAIPASFRGLVAAPGKLYLGTGSGILASSDGGATFAPVLAGVSALTTDGKEVLAAKGTTVYRVAPDETLTELSSVTPKRCAGPQPCAQVGEEVRALGFVEGQLFASTARRLFHSNDGAKTWKAVAGAPRDIQEIVGSGKTLVVHATSGAHLRDANGKWSQRTLPATNYTLSRVQPGASRVWLTFGGVLAQAATLGDPPARYGFPGSPMPTVRALAAHQKSLVIALYRPPGVHVSSDGGRSWQPACANGTPAGAMLDAGRLQLSAPYGMPWSSLKDCRVPGLKTRVVPKLPDETCNGHLCVRFGPDKLLRSRDRGKTWEDLTPNLGSGLPIVAAAAAGREILLARGSVWSKRLSSVQEFVTLQRSTDDGRSFESLALSLTVTSFAPSDDGWFLGTFLYGVVRLPYLTGATTGTPDRTKRDSR